jgi:3-deoxy-D-manno-octulosonic acid kinase
MLGPVRAVVRHARRGGLLGPLLGDRFAGRPRFLREIALAEALREAGIPTPPVLAGLAYLTPLWHRADVATERVDGRDLASTLFGDDAPSGPSRRDLLHAVGRLVRRLHEAGFVHPDLQLRNVLVDTGSGAVWLLDVDTCRRIAATDDDRRRANLARFERSWDKWNRARGPRLTTADRESFDAGYREPAG